jgi:hypothetical protein
MKSPELMQMQRRLITEAKHTTSIILGMVGLDSVCNRFLLKYPDAMDSLLVENNKAFYDDMVNLICTPIQVLAEALVLRVVTISHQTDYQKVMLQEIKEIIERQQIDPFKTKKELIQLCNYQIDKLTALGIKVGGPIKEIDETQK